MTSPLDKEKSMTEPDLTPDDERPAATAGEESHEEPWDLAAEEADAPEDAGRPEDPL